MNAAIIVAAGTGSRMGAEMPKQFLKIGGEYILAKTLRAFEESEDIREIVLVLSPEWIDFTRREILEKEGFYKFLKIVPGGAERYDSVYAGLLACPEADYVLIHDGARPFVTQEVIHRACTEAAATGAVAVGVPAKDTVKIVDENGYVTETPVRSRTWLVQTPQAFEYDMIRMAYEIVREKGMAGVTDDAMVVELSRLSRVRMIMGDYRNIKITTPDDLRGYGEE